MNEERGNRLKKIRCRNLIFIFWRKYEMKKDEFFDARMVRWLCS